MGKVRLVDFAGLLEKGEWYYFRLDKDAIRVYSSRELRAEELVAELHYTVQEWTEFLKTHNCNLERGDYRHYVGAKCKNRRKIHREEEDGIQFDISHGKHYYEVWDIDWIRII